MGNPTGRRVLITGAYGLIGNLVYARLEDRADSYEPFAMLRRAEPSRRAATGDVRAIPRERQRIADLRDFGAVLRSMEGIDVVVHMAAVVEGTEEWARVLESNIIGSYNIFEAGRQAGVKRIVYASSNQVVFGYRNDEPYKTFLETPPDRLADARLPPIRHDQPVRPMNLYACSKVFGEALAHMYAYSHGLSCICLRIGWVTPDDVVSRPFLWCSRRDVVQLVERAIEAPPTLRYDVVFGHSDNENNLVDITHTQESLGYRRRDGRNHDGTTRLAR